MRKGGSPAYQCLFEHRSAFDDVWARMQLYHLRIRSSPDSVPAMVSVQFPCVVTCTGINCMCVLKPQMLAAVPLPLFRHMKIQHRLGQPSNTKHGCPSGSGIKNSWVQFISCRGCASFIKRGIQKEDECTMQQLSTIIKIRWGWVYCGTAKQAFKDKIVQYHRHLEKKAMW